MTDGLTYKMPLEVYLQAAVVRGVLETNQSRLSSHLILREGDEVFAAELRARVMAQAHELQTAQKTNIKIFNLANMKITRFTYAAAAAALEELPEASV